MRAGCSCLLKDRLAGHWSVVSDVGLICLWTEARSAG